MNYNGYYGKNANNMMEESEYDPSLDTWFFDDLRSPAESTQKRT
jgi:hypothetical protein